MVIVKRRTVDSGSNGYGTLIVPRARRSTRKRNLAQESLEGSELCAFELLATVAGKLLEESECSSAASSAPVGFDQHGVCKDSVKKEPLDVDKSLGSSEGSVYFCGKVEAVNDGTVERVSHLASSVCSEKVDPDSKSVIQINNDDFVKFTSKIIRNFPSGEESDDNNIGNEQNRKLDIAMAKESNCEEILDLLFSNCRDNDVQKTNTSSRDNDVKIGSKDDDEILSQCSKLNNKRKIFRSLPGIGDRRFKKLHMSKYWKTAPKLKDCEDINSALDVYHKRPCYGIDRSQRNTPFKKRKLFEKSSIVTYDGGISSESVSNLPEKSRDDDKNTLLHAGNGKPPSGFKRQNSYNSRNSHVRLSIKSFKIPELFVEVPESASVASLKSTVLEAVTSILGGGLRVGVLVHGKKIRDDNKTLLQTGISENIDIDTVGFMLEPKGHTQISPPIGPKTPIDPLFIDTPKFANSSQISPKEEMFLLGSLDKPSVTDSTVGLPEKNVSDSKVAVLPADEKYKHSEVGQRRIRRPFSVSEVEALVHAVEKLGTGRWRDVKLCSFENAKHRTYVDLKDKWKTLVHTARISPHQRRGEPVPQELLDRVLDAQAHWTEHQAKQIGKTAHYYP